MEDFTTHRYTDENLTHCYADEIHTAFASSSSPSSSSCSSLTPLSSDSDSDSDDFDDLDTPPPLSSDTIGTDAWNASRDKLIEEWRVGVYAGDPSTEEDDEDTMDDESDTDEGSEGECVAQVERKVSPPPPPLAEKVASEEGKKLRIVIKPTAPNRPQHPLPITTDQQHLLRFLMETYAPNYTTVATYFNAISAPLLPYPVHRLRQYWRVMTAHKECRLTQREQTLLTWLVETFGPHWKVIRKWWAVGNEDRTEHTLRQYWYQMREDLRRKERG
ncbi:hypothetical protein HK104_006483 [Borealophlyctis nickersoniae]|nr:hypothetical protein HK104_006483 [Borealophlyctis nickersoniae]